MSGSAGRTLSARDVLRIADFRRIWAAQAISDLGDGMTSLALLLVVTLLTGSTAALAVMAISLAVPAIVVGPVAGVFVDRWDRRRVMLASDLIRAAVVLGFIVVRSADMVWILFLLAVVHATVGTFFTPARMAFVPRIVPAEGLLAANSLSQATRITANVTGGMAAGVFVGTFGTAWPAFTIDALTFVASFLLVLRVRRSARAEQGEASGVDAAGESQAQRSSPQPRRGALDDLREGLGVVRRSPTLVGVLVGAGMAMLGLGAVNVLFVPLMIRELHQPATWIGAADAAQTVSMVAAAGLVGAFARRFGPGTPIVVGLVAIAAFCGLLAAVSDLWQVLILLFAVGWFVTPLTAAVATIVQTAVDDARRGRVAALLHSVMSSASVLSMAFAGVFGDLLGVRVVFVMAAIVIGVAALAAAVLFRLPARSTVAPAAAAPALDRVPGLD